MNQRCIMNKGRIIQDDVWTNVRHLDSLGGEYVTTETRPLRADSIDQRSGGKHPSI